mmetsp:Transcript_13973/g.24708  ORF Transcript_13973/g.24708 Transcript_13973/m.24708 type:complete len:89 (-) Transcript_13973:198-464(-)
MPRANGNCLSNCVISLLWFLFLWFIAFAVAFFCAPWYIFLQPLEVICRCKLNLWLLKGVQLPEYATKEMLRPWGFEGAFEGYMNLPEP